MFALMRLTQTIVFVLVFVLELLAPGLGNFLIDGLSVTGCYIARLRNKLTISALQATRTGLYLCVFSRDGFVNLVFLQTLTRKVCKERQRNRLLYCEVA